MKTVDRSAKAWHPRRVDTSALTVSPPSEHRGPTSNAASVHRVALALSEASSVSLSTAKRWLQGARVSRDNWDKLNAAAVALGYSVQVSEAVAP